MKWLKRLLKKKKPLECGGERRIAVCDDLGREVASIWYTMPDSDLKISYVYDSQFALTDIEGLKEIKSKDKKKIAQEMHKMILERVYIPYAEKVFLKSKGFVCEGEAIDDYDKEKQFEYIAKYYSHCLVDMVLIAFDGQVTVKKKH